MDEIMRRELAVAAAMRKNFSSHTKWKKANYVRECVCGCVNGRTQRLSKYIRLAIEVKRSDEQIYKFKLNVRYNL